MLCNLCFNYLPSQQQLTRHQIKNHGKDRSTKKNKLKVKCDFCPDRFLNTARFVAHARRRHLEQVIKDWFKCSRCKKYFHTEEHLKRHQSLSHKSLKRLLDMCSYCDEQVPRTRYTKHVNKEHLDVICKVWERCDKCSLYLPTEQALSVHRSHCRGPGVLCHFCPNRFSRNKEYTRHANAKHKDLLSEQWLNCPDCDLFVETEAGLVKHLRDSHAKKVDRKSIEREKNQASDAKQIDASGTGNDEDNGEEAGRVQCQFCRELFFTSNMSAYYVHANESHSEELLTHWYRCQDCDKFYPTKTSFHMHRRYTFCSIL